MENVFTTIEDEKSALLQELKEQYLERYRRYEDLGKENITIYNEYNFVFGKVYYRRYELYCLCERARRKIELYQIYLNRDELIDEQKVEQTLESEFLEYERKLNLILEEYNNAVRFQSLPTLSSDEVKEIRRIYIKIAKAIHPDLNPDASESAKDLWLKTLDAYKRNDLETLEESEILFDNLNEKFSLATPEPENLDKEMEQYKKKIEDYQDKINYLMNSFPYNQKALLENKTLVKERIMEVERDIQFFKDNLSKLEAHILDLNPIYEKHLC